MFTTPQDYYKMVTDSFASIPKTQGDAIKLLEKVKTVYLEETRKATEMVKTFRKAAIGDATVNEITEANKKAQDLLITARFAALMTIPGAIFMIPTLSKLELELNSVDFIPDSVKREFNL